MSKGVSFVGRIPRRHGSPAEQASSKVQYYLGWPKLQERIPDQIEVVVVGKREL
jgi:hypothetical protein